MLEDVTQVDCDQVDEADELGEDADTGEVVLLFPDVHGNAPGELRGRIAELQAENRALRAQVSELEDFNREAALSREKVFMRMRRELARRQRAIESLEADRDAAARQIDEAQHRIGECEALLKQRAAEREQAAARIAELEQQLAEMDQQAEVTEAYRSELEGELDGLRAERAELVECIREREDALEAAGIERHEAIVALEKRHRAELQRLHERAVRALTLQWMALASS